MTDVLARVLFRNESSRVRRKKLRHLLIVLSVGVVVSAGLGLTLYLINTSGPTPSNQLPPGVEPPQPKAYRR